MHRLLAILLILLAGPVAAQVNVEDKRLARDSAGLSGSLTVSVQLERGNSELTEIGIRPRFVYRVARSQWFMLNNYQFVETGEASVINEGFSHFRYNYEATDIVVIEALTQVQYNREQDLRRRFLFGGGLRFELLDRPRATLAVGVTALYEHEELEGDITIETPRNSDYVSVAVKGSENLTLTNTLYIQPAFNAISDIRVLDNLECVVSIARWLAIAISLEYRYDSEPPAGIKEYDLTLSNGFTVRF